MNDYLMSILRIDMKLLLQASPCSHKGISKNIH